MLPLRGATTTCDLEDFNKQIGKINIPKADH